MVRRSLAVAVQAVFVLAVAQAASGQTADQLVAKNIQAKGGEQALRGIQTIRQSGQMTLQGMSASMTMIAKRPNLMRQEIDLNGQPMVMAFDGTTAWTMNPAMGVTSPMAIPAEQGGALLKDQAQFDGPLLDYKTNGTKVEVVGQETINGKPAHHLKVTLKSGAAQDLYLDAETGLDVRLVIQTPAGPSIQDLSDYRRVNGLMVPFSVKMTVGGVPQGEMKVTSIEFNVPVDDAIFKMK